MRMDDWFKLIDGSCDLWSRAVQDLSDVGFVVIPGPVAPDRLAQFAEAYDSAEAGSVSDDISIGSSTTRVDDFVNRGPEFDSPYVYEPVLKRSIQGSYIRRDAKPAVNQAASIRSETLGRIGPLAKYVLAV